VDPNLLAPELIDLYENLEGLILKDPDVINLGPLAKKDYYRNLAESALVVYPCSFPEISCIVALEAQALGVPILATNDYALTESIAIDWFKVPGRPKSPEYAQNYVERALDILSQPEKTAKLSGAAKKNIREFHSWERIALEWERLFRLGLKAKSSPESLIQANKRHESLLV
jgi:glycosyltransferase involved in cell wall biosynthesis